MSIGNILSRAREAAISTFAILGVVFGFSGIAGIAIHVIYSILCIAYCVFHTVFADTMLTITYDDMPLSGIVTHIGIISIGTLIPVGVVCALLFYIIIPKNELKALQGNSGDV